MRNNHFDVLIIGGGAAGLMAAVELVKAGKKTAILEARNRLGGRIHSFENDDFTIPVELGAEFVHGDLKITQMLVKKAGTGLQKINGSLWQKGKNGLQEQEDFIEDFNLLEKKFKEVKEDIPVSEFIKQHLQGEEFDKVRITIQNYVEGYYAADINKASTLALCEELTTSDDVQYRIEGGYKKLIDYLYNEADQRGCIFYLSQPVKSINWQKNKIEVITTAKTFLSSKLLVTVPLGVLQSETITFSPALPNKMAEAKNLGFGPVIKLLLQFDKAFWREKDLTQQKDLKKFSFLFSDEPIPTWWTQFPDQVPLLTGWLGGPHAEKLKNDSDEEILQKALQTLEAIFSIQQSRIKQWLKAWKIINWMNDPYCNGAYAYEVVNGKMSREILNQPVDNTLFFAGEALHSGPEIGTVEAALISGHQTAQSLIASF